jgi:hypothetical protein
MYRSTFFFITSALVGGEWSVSCPGRTKSEGKSPRYPLVGNWVEPGTGLDDVKRRNILLLPGLELRPVCRLARSQSLYRLSYPGSSFMPCTFIKFSAYLKHFLVDEFQNSAARSTVQHICLQRRHIISHFLLSFLFLPKYTYVVVLINFYAVCYRLNYRLLRPLVIALYGNVRQQIVQCSAHSKDKETLKCSTLWYTPSCRPVKVNRRFGGIYL